MARDGLRFYFDPYIGYTVRQQEALQSKMTKRKPKKGKRKPKKFTKAKKKAHTNAKKDLNCCWRYATLFDLFVF
jgi:hypothetical protein